MLSGLYAMERRRDDLWNVTEEMLQHGSPTQRHEPLAMRARFEFEMVDPQVALGELEAALVQNPQDMDTLRAVGLYHLEAGNTEKARSHLYRAVQENPNSVRAWESWLLCLHQTADMFGLQQAVRELPEEAESSAECWRFRALAAERDDDLDQAIAAARRAIELKPFEPENYHRLGQYLVRKGQKEEGQALLARNVELQNVQQKLREAYDKYRHEYAAATSDQRGEIAFQLGQRYDELGHSRAAAAWYRLALSESPSHAQSISALERVENP
jgi:tetratricopeptide (TPR) repeat protein